MKLKKKNDGFTLVELIVVIAILAILAGVAVPAYSGYVKKAEKAGDLTLLAAVNDAFAAACMAVDVDIKELDANSAKMPIVNKKISAEAIEPEEVRESFKLFYQGNFETEFKVITALVFDPATMTFIDDADTKIVQGSDGKTYPVNVQKVRNFKDAKTFSENLPATQNQVNQLTGAFANLLEINGGLSGMDGKFGVDYDKFMEENGIDGSDLNAVANATVMYVADKTEDMTAQDIANKFGTMSQVIGNSTDLTQAFANSDDMLTDASLMYGALYAYVNSDSYDEKSNVSKDDVLNVKSAEDLFTVFQQAATDTDYFYNYVGTMQADGTVSPGIQFETDMNGFLGALDTMDAVSGGIDLTQKDVWSGDEVNNLLSQILG